MRAEIPEKAFLNEAAVDLSLWGLNKCWWLAVALDEIDM